MQPDISMWNVLEVILLPLLGGGFLLIWRRLDKAQTDLWLVINELRVSSAAASKELSDHKLECERAYVRKDLLAQMEARIEDRLDRFEKKLDDYLKFTRPHPAE